MPVPTPPDHNVDQMKFVLDLRRRGIMDAAVLRAMEEVPRDRFVMPAHARSAYLDRAMPIACGQTISQPFVVAFMTEALELEGGERVLEIGTGSGYQAAVLSLLCREVCSIEVVDPLFEQARARLTRFPNVRLRRGDGRLGWPEAAPFDGVLLTAAPERLPDALISQLAPGGRLVAPVGESADMQRLVRVTKDASGDVEVENLLPVRFVPMTAREWVH